MTYHPHLIPSDKPAIHDIFYAYGSDTKTGSPVQRPLKQEKDYGVLHIGELEL